MENAQRAAMTEERVLPYPFWVGLAACATPDVQSQLLQTTRSACSAVVQSALSVALTTRLSAPPAPDTLSLLHTSNRTLPASVIIVNDNQLFTHRHANSQARLIIPRLGSAAVTSLALRTDPEGKGWLVDGGLLQDIHASLPGLRELELQGVVSTSTHPSAYSPATQLHGLTTVALSMPREQPPEGVAALLAALGVRSGGSVALLTLTKSQFKASDPVDHQLGNRKIGVVLGSMLRDNQLRALRKLSLPLTSLDPDLGDEPVIRALIRDAPALEHVQLNDVKWPGQLADESVPWRILDVAYLHVATWQGLPLASTPGQPPLIVRVSFWLACYGPGQDDADVAAAHLTSTAPGHREVRLECGAAVYEDSVCTHVSHMGPLLRVFTLTRFGLSNLILDGIDTEDDVEDLVELSSITITLDSSEEPLDLDQLQVGLAGLPHVTKLEVRAQPSGDETAAQLWAIVSADLLACLPPHVTYVRLSGSPSVDLVCQICVRVSRVPHRQALPLRLSVPDVPDWFGAVSRALRAEGIEEAGLLGVP